MSRSPILLKLRCRTQELAHTTDVDCYQFSQNYEGKARTKVSIISGANFSDFITADHHLLLDLEKMCPLANAVNNIISTLPLYSDNNIACKLVKHTLCYHSFFGDSTILHISSECFVNMHAALFLSVHKLKTPAYMWCIRRYSCQSTIAMQLSRISMDVFQKSGLFQWNGMVETTSFYCLC